MANGGVTEKDFEQRKSMKFSKSPFEMIQKSCRMPWRENVAFRSERYRTFPLSWTLVEMSDTLLALLYARHRLSQL